MSALGAQTLARLSLHVPPSGMWRAEAWPLTGPAPAPGLTTLVVADLSLVGYVLADRGGEDGPENPHVVVVGGAGWLTTLARPASYASPAGVRLLSVLRDLAGLAKGPGSTTGMPYDVPQDKVLGRSYGWDAPTTGERVLADLVTRGAVPTWRVLPSGNTSFTAWPATGVADASARVLSRNLAQGVRRLGLDTRVAALLPGASIEGARVARLFVRESAGELAAEVRES